MTGHFGTMVRVQVMSRLGGAALVAAALAACMGGQSFDDGADPLDLGPPPTQQPPASDGEPPSKGSSMTADAGAGSEANDGAASSEASNGAATGAASDGAASGEASDGAATESAVVSTDTLSDAPEVTPDPQLETSAADWVDAGDSESDEPALSPNTAASTDASGSVDANGDAGATVFAGDRPLCGDSVSEANAAWCEGIQNIALSTAELVDANGDGKVAPGEEVSIVVVMHNESDEGYNYPCVGLLADNANVTIIGGEAHDNPAWDYYTIPGQETLEVTLTFRVGPEIPPATRIRFIAWLDVLNAGCTNGTELQFEVQVQ